MTTKNPVRLLTSGEIARRIKRPSTRVLYVLKKHPDIEPSALAGRTRLYRESVVSRIRYELNLIDAKRGNP